MKHSKATFPEPALSTGSREAVEAAIDAAKTRKSTTWDEVASGALGRFPQWEEKKADKKGANS